MLAEAIGGIIGLAILFFTCGVLCYCLGSYMLQDEPEDTAKPAVEVFNAKFYYDPLPSVLSPPEALTKPSVYSFKIQNGHHPHAVINPAVLANNYPPGHIFDDNRQIIPSTFQIVSKPQNSHSRGSRNSSKVSPKNYPDPEEPLQTDMQTMPFIPNGRPGRKGWLS